MEAGIITDGLDNACGIAAFTLMPASTGILTSQFKTSLLAPARWAAVRLPGQGARVAPILPQCILMLWAWQGVKNPSMVTPCN